MNNKFNTRHHF